MTETRVRGTKREVTISSCRPAVIIGDRINAATRDRVAEACRRRDVAFIQEEAVLQAREGARVLSVNARAEGVEEVEALAWTIQAIAESSPLPLCIDTVDPAALAAALAVCPGRPLVNGISCKESALSELLPLAVEHGAAVIGKALTDEGVPRTLEERVEVAREVLRQSITAGIAREDVILDPLALAIDDDGGDASIALESIGRLARIEAVNLTLQPGRITGDLPQPQAIANTFCALAIRQGVTCPIVDPVEGKEAVLIANLLLGKDGALGEYVDGLN